MQYTNDSVELALWKKKIAGKKNKPDNIWTLDYGMKRVLDGGYAFHVQINNALQMIYDEWSEKAICELTYVTLRNPGKLFLGIQKSSSLLQIWNIG